MKTGQLLEERPDWDWEDWEGGPRWREEPAPADMGGTISEIYRVFFFTGPPLKR